MKTRSGPTISTLAATLSASCCVLLVALLVLGFTSPGPFAFLMRYRPLPLILGFLLLGAAFYAVCRPLAEAVCAQGLCSPRALCRQRRIVWVSAALMVLFALLGSLPITIGLAGLAGAQKRRSAMDATWHKLKGWFAGITAFVTCPCHLPLTLPLLIDPMSGTALGAWLARNTILIYALATAYFLAALPLAIRWMNRASGNERMSSALPAKNP